MSNWDILNRFRVRSGPFASDESLGFNGFFCLWVRTRRGNERVKAMASDGGGWQHVSVSLADHQSTPPDWEIMCAVKDLFWEPEDCVVQFHPPASEYVNHHPGCLHLWRCTDGREQPRPPTEFVGPPVKPKPKTEIIYNSKA